LLSSKKNGAGGRWETDTARVVLLELDTSLGLHS